MCVKLLWDTGATESQGTLANLGLSKEQGAQVSEYYWAHMNTVYAELLKRGKFAWQLLWTGQQHCSYKNSYGCLGTTGTNILINKQNCAAKLKSFCTAGSDAQTRAMMFPFAVSSETSTVLTEKKLLISKLDVVLTDLMIVWMTVWMA